MKFLPALCQKYGVQFIDVRSPWKQYLKDRSLKSTDLLKDYIHPNAIGDSLLAAIMKPQFAYNSAYKPDLLNRRKLLTVGEDVQFKNDTLEFVFEGNKLDVSITQSSNCKMQVLIDGLPPSSLAACYGWERPQNNGWDWPWNGSIIGIDSESMLQEEDWTITITAVNEAMDDFTFDLTGSKTGFDGSGDGNTKFTSNSGRVVILPEHWFMAESHTNSGRTISAGYTIKWKSVLYGQDTVSLSAPGIARWLKG